MGTPKIVLLLGANSDVAKEALKLYVGQGYRVIAASRNTEALQEFIAQSIVADERIRPEQSATAGQPVMVIPFEAIVLSGLRDSYVAFRKKRHFVVFPQGGKLVNEAALWIGPGTTGMWITNYCGRLS